MANKYRNKRTPLDGYVFDSYAEMNRYLELKFLLHAGVISGLELQPEFELQPSFKVGRKTERAIKYRADFKYCENGQTIIEDLKGMKTEIYKIKRKMLLFKYPDIVFRETTA